MGCEVRTSEDGDSLQSGEAGFSSGGRWTVRQASKMHHIDEMSARLGSGEERREREVARYALWVARALGSREFLRWLCKSRIVAALV